MQIHEYPGDKYKYRYTNIYANTKVSAGAHPYMNQCKLKYRHKHCVCKPDTKATANADTITPGPMDHR